MIGLVKTLGPRVAAGGVALGLTGNHLATAGFDLLGWLELAAVIIAALIAAFAKKKK